MYFDKLTIFRIIFYFTKYIQSYYNTNPGGMLRKNSYKFSLACSLFKKIAITFISFNSFHI